MLYILVYDLFGWKLENFGIKILLLDKKYSKIINDFSNYDDFWEDLLIFFYVGN